MVVLLLCLYFLSHHSISGDVVMWRPRRPHKPKPSRCYFSETRVHHHIIAALLSTSSHLFALRWSSVASANTVELHLFFTVVDFRVNVSTDHVNIFQHYLKVQLIFLYWLRKQLNPLVYLGGTIRLFFRKARELFIRGKCRTRRTQPSLTV